MALPPLSPPAASILDLIGRTPMVRLNRLSPIPRVAIYDERKVDRHVMVESEAAFELAARTVAAELAEGTIVTIFPDRGEKYLSTALFEV
jgi:cysteine synthase